MKLIKGVLTTEAGFVRRHSADQKSWTWTFPNGAGVIKMTALTWEYRDALRKKKCGGTYSVHDGIQPDSEECLVIILVEATKRLRELKAS